MMQLYFTSSTKLDLIHELEKWIREWMVGHQIEFKISYLAILNMLLYLFYIIDGVKTYFVYLNFVTHNPCSASCLLHLCSFFALYLDTENGGDTFL